MKAAKRKKLESAGWKIGSAADFLGLTPEEEAYIELKLSLSRQLKAFRAKKKISQAELAREIKSSQSRVAKMEAGDSTVSLDLLVKSLLAVGATSRDLAKAISSTS